jgi:hypothetical protein
MTLREFCCQRWRESFRESNPFPLLFSTRESDDAEGDRAFGLILLLFYWLLLPLWAGYWLKAEWVCLCKGHDWNDYVAPEAPRLFATCRRCEIEYVKAQQLD